VDDDRRRHSTLRRSGTAQKCAQTSKTRLRRTRAPSTNARCHGRRSAVMRPSAAPEPPSGRFRRSCASAKSAVSDDDKLTILLLPDPQMGFNGAALGSGGVVSTVAMMQLTLWKSNA
jgi:hypothetical protein